MHIIIKLDCTAAFHYKMEMIYTRLDPSEFRKDTNKLFKLWFTFPWYLLLLLYHMAFNLHL